MLTTRLHNKILAALLLAACIFFSMQVHAEEMLLFYDNENHVYNAEPVQLFIDGKQLDNLPMPPIIMNERTLVPARETFEALGAVVSWNNSNNEVYIGYNNKLIILQIDNPVANIDNSLEIMDVAPKIINDKTMIPLRFVSESIGLTVDWNIDTRDISISNKQIPVSVAPVGLPQAVEPAPDPSNAPADISTEKIPKQQNPQTKITNILVPTSDTSVFTISATSAITAVETFSLGDNRIVLDFYNAEMSSERTLWAVDGPIVEQIRIAQNQTVPEMITRVVFDLSLAIPYRVTISPDRTQVYMIFENVSVDGVDYYSDTENDYIDIVLSNPASVNVFHLTNPDRVVIDVPGSTIQDVYTAQVDGHFAKEIRSSQFEPYNSRIVVEIKQKALHYVSTLDNVVTVKLSEPTFKNITYDENSRLITIAKGGFPISANAITHYDAYRVKKYVLTLPLDLSSVIGYGEYMAAGNYLQSITINNNSIGLTELVLNGSSILAVKVTDDNDYIYINVLLPREAYDKIVVIDAGHGDHDPGAVSNGLKEKDVNLSIANKVMALFEAHGQIKAYATRTDDTFVGLSDRAAFGNSVADLFVSIHNNAAEKNPNAMGTEAYYYNHSFEDTLWVSGRTVAETLHAKLVSYLSSYKRRVAMDDLAVTRESKIPAALLEIGFITSPEEAAKLGDDSYRQLAAQAIFDGIVEIFTNYTPPR